MQQIIVTRFFAFPYVYLSVCEEHERVAIPLIFPIYLYHLVGQVLGL